MIQGATGPGGLRSSLQIFPNLSICLRLTYFYCECPNSRTEYNVDPNLNPPPNQHDIQQQHHTQPMMVLTKRYFVSAFMNLRSGNLPVDFGASYHLLRLHLFKRLGRPTTLWVTRVIICVVLLRQLGCSRPFVTAGNPKNQTSHELLQRAAPCDETATIVVSSSACPHTLAGRTLTKLRREWETETRRTPCCERAAWPTSTQRTPYLRPQLSSSLRPSTGWTIAYER